VRKTINLVFVMVMTFTLFACSSNNNDIASNNETTNNTMQEEIPTITEKDAQTSSGESGELLEFPEDYEEGVLYTTVTRGSTYEELYTSREAIEAVQSGQPIPSGTVITLLIYRNGDLSQYFVMEKRDSGGEQYPPELRNGEWEYQAFTADGAVDYEEDIENCLSCHGNRESDDYVNTLDEMESYVFEEEISGDNKLNTISKFAGNPSEGWVVKEIGNDHENIINEEKERLIQNVLLTFYFHQGKS
jgi:hypothetical protein